MMRILNYRICQKNDVDIRTAFEESTQTMRDLYETARRIALKVDESLDSIIAELDKE